jgi:hypothetical protein
MLRPASAHACRAHAAASIDQLNSRPDAPKLSTCVPESSTKMAGTPTINQLLAKLADRRLIEIARGRVVITDLPGLARKAR